MATVLTRTEPFDLFKDEVPGYPEGMKVHPDSYSDPYRQARKDGVEFKSIQDVAKEMAPKPTDTDTQDGDGDVDDDI